MIIESMRDFAYTVKKHGLLSGELADGIPERASDAMPISVGSWTRAGTAMLTHDVKLGL